MSAGWFYNYICGGWWGNCSVPRWENHARYAEDRICVFYNVSTLSFLSDV